MLPRYEQLAVSARCMPRFPPLLTATTCTTARLHHPENHLLEPRGGARVAARAFSLELAGYTAFTPHCSLLTAHCSLLRRTARSCNRMLLQNKQHCWAESHLSDNSERHAFLPSTSRARTVLTSTPQRAALCARTAHIYSTIAFCSSITE